MNAKLSKIKNYDLGLVVSALELEEDKNVGKLVRFKNPKFPDYQGTFEIVCRQKMYGDTPDGSYGIVEGYRVVNIDGSNDFGNPAQLKDLEFLPETQEEETSVPEEETSVPEVDLTQYDKIIVAFSGGKDSTACFLHLIDQGVPTEKIELWHHDIDGRGPLFMDWESTPSYCRAFAKAFNVPIFFSWKEGGFETVKTLSL